jgi:hypothetical protein
MRKYSVQRNKGYPHARYICEDIRGETENFRPSDPGQCHHYLQNSRMGNGSFPIGTTSPLPVSEGYGMNNREVIGTMQPIPITPGNNLAPYPFDRDSRDLTQPLKIRGRPWKTIVGRFAWDHQRIIRRDAPFPIFSTLASIFSGSMKFFVYSKIFPEMLAWLPVGHQVRLHCQRYGIDPATTPLTTLPANGLKILINGVSKPLKSVKHRRSYDAFHVRIRRSRTSHQPIMEVLKC